MRNKPYNQAVADSNQRRATHGGSKTKLYKTWRNIKNRCNNQKDKDYAKYGGRGIKLASEWYDFANFKADIGLRPSPGHSIERIDNDGPYSKENCVWATAAQQGRNKSSNRLITYNGVTKCLTDWALYMGLKVETLKGRIDTYKWSVERALTTPVIALKDCWKFRKNAKG